MEIYKIHELAVDIERGMLERLGNVGRMDQTRTRQLLNVSQAVQERSEVAG
jgi:hypothetical protein